MVGWTWTHFARFPPFPSPNRNVIFMVYSEVHLVACIGLITFQSQEPVTSLQCSVEVSQIELELKGAHSQGQEVKYNNMLVILESKNTAMPYIVHITLHVYHTVN